MTTPTVEAGGPVADLPTTAKYVHFALRVHDEPLTRAEIERVTGLPERSVQRALRELREAGCVERWYRLADTQTPVYDVNDP